MPNRTQWIFGGEIRPNAYVYLRGGLTADATPAAGRLRVAADSRYQVWVNGHYVGQGPVPFKRPFIRVDEYDVSPWLRPGMNAVACLLHYCGVNHCQYAVGSPGLWLEMDIDDAQGGRTTLRSGPEWRALPATAYACDTPRRTWASGWTEHFDAALALPDFHLPDFDDAGWPGATVMDPGPVEWLPRAVPPLRENYEPASRLFRVRACPADAGDRTRQWDRPEVTRRLDEEPHVAPPPDAPVPVAAVEWPLTLPASNDAVALSFDMGEMLAGQIEFEVESCEGVLIDYAPTEARRPDGRPWCLRKSGQYARRYRTRAGRQAHRMYQYDIFRYIHFVVRGPCPGLIIHRIGVWRREAAQDIQARFFCDDPIWNRIWEITRRTIRAGSQEIQIDSSRELASAWGDHIWSGYWTALATGQASYLRHLMETLGQLTGLARDPQLPRGQIPCYAFSSCHPGPLYDFSLIALWGLALYDEIADDAAFMGSLLSSAEYVLDYYRRRIGSSGLVEIDGDRMMENWRQESWKNGIECGQLFIDHPGLGSHNIPENRPGIDRSGISAGLNCFFILALAASRDAALRAGDAARAGALDAEIAALRSRVEEIFFDPERGLYVDAFKDGVRSPRASQQINALAILAEVCPPGRRRTVLERVLDPADPDICPAGPYFWTYLVLAMQKAGLRDRLLAEVGERWNAMAKAGATTWWETFLGDELDSLCHIWSSAPIYVVFTEILGIRPCAPGWRRVKVSPALGRFAEIDGQLPLAGGFLRVRWAAKDGRGALEVNVPEGVEALLDIPASWLVSGGGDPCLPLSTGRNSMEVVVKHALSSPLKKPALTPGTASASVERVKNGLNKAVFNPVSPSPSCSRRQSGLFQRAVRGCRIGKPPGRLRR